MTPGSVVVRPYDDSWPREFERVRAELLEIFPPWVLSIEHVGSTSVPGLDAKPIIDILVGVPSLEEGLGLKEPLGSIGFEYRPFDDLPDRHYFPRTIEGLRMHHVSLAEPTSRHYRNSILFRDVLRTNPDIATGYVALKRQLARDVGTVRFAYMNGKTEFVHSVLKRFGGDVEGDHPVRDLGSRRPNRAR